MALINKFFSFVCIGMWVDKMSLKQNGLCEEHVHFSSLFTVECKCIM